MKAVSLWQPWATALFLRDADSKRIKPDETRCWPIAYRGPIAIHAAKAVPVPGMDYSLELDAVLRLLLGKTTADLPRGCILGYGQVVACDRAPKVRARRSPAQTLWGNYDERDGNGRLRFAWTIDQMTPLVFPVPWRGQQGLFDVPDSVLMAARAAERKFWPDE